MEDEKDIEDKIDEMGKDWFDKLDSSLDKITKLLEEIRDKEKK